MKTMGSNLTITDFSFLPWGYGHYKVRYTSPITGKSWATMTNNMPLIDATKNADSPLKYNLIILKRLCKDGQQVITI
jgi:hypothetical protein